MAELFIQLLIIILVIVALFVLYYQTRIYAEQKELIDKESKALKIIRHQNLEALRSRFLLRRVKLKA